MAGGPPLWNEDGRRPKSRETPCFKACVMESGAMGAIGFGFFETGTEHAGN